MNKNSKKKVKLKKGLFQRLFWVISCLFIITIIGYYGFRFVVVSGIYNNKDMKLSEYIIKNIDQDKGLYKEKKGYIFKGNTESNYIKYENLLFRIIKIYQDGSVEIVMDQGLNSLFYNNKYTDYLESDIHKYLNDEFLDIIDKEDLNKTPICKDVVNSIDMIACNEIDYSSYVKLLQIGDYVNSIKDNETYLGKEGEYYWLGNTTGDKIWNIDGVNLSQSDELKGYKIRPVITLNEMVKYLSGTGEKDDPILIKKEEVGISSYVKIDNDLYIVIDKEKSYLKMMLMEDSPLVREVYNDDLLDNLNDKYYKSLSYKKKLVKYTISIGDYKNSYKDIKDKKESVYVGIPMVNDFKLDNSDLEYLLINKYGSEVLYYDKLGLHNGDGKIARKIRPVIMIKKQEISSGNGTIDNPYIVEVK